MSQALAACAALVPHFSDQALMYSEGRFRDVLFTLADVSAHAERRYHPGEP